MNTDPVEHILNIIGKPQLFFAQLLKEGRNISGINGGRINDILTIRIVGTDGI